MVRLDVCAKLWRDYIIFVEARAMARNKTNYYVDCSVASCTIQAIPWSIKNGPDP